MIIEITTLSYNYHLDGVCDDFKIKTKNQKASTKPNLYSILQ